MRGCEVSRRAPDARRDGGKHGYLRKAISVRKSLSCRFFGLGKGALRLEILVDRMSSAAGAWTLGPGDRETCQGRFAESLKGFREALKPATVKAEVTVAGVA